MEIIHRGTKPEDEVYVATCYNCKTKVRCTKKDQSRQFTVDKHALFVVECPVCNRGITITHMCKESNPPNYSWYDR